MYNTAQQVDGENFEVVKSLAPMRLRRYSHKTIYCNGQVYVFGGYDQYTLSVKHLDKYSLITNTWEQHVLHNSNYRDISCAYAFMDQIFILGSGDDCPPSNVCIKLDTKDMKWKEVARMNEFRRRAACTIFEGKIFVSGGWSGTQSLNTLEAYDKLVALGHGSSTATCYDVDKDEWLEKSFEATKNTSCYGCAVVPKIDI